MKSKLVCQWRQVCRNCNFVVKADSKRECFKKFCNYCNTKQPSGHFCYVASLKPSKLTDKLMYVFSDMECTQDLDKRDGSFEHIRNLVCAQQICSKCEAIRDLNIDCEQCESVSTCSVKSQYVNLLNMSGCSDQLRIHCMLLHIPLSNMTHSYCHEGFWKRN